MIKGTINKPIYILEIDCGEYNNENGKPWSFIYKNAIQVDKALKNLVNKKDKFHYNKHTWLYKENILHYNVNVDNGLKDDDIEGMFSLIWKN